MAAPESITNLSLSGIFILDKALSDDPSPILLLQQVAWLIRTYIKNAIVEVSQNHYTAEDDKTYIRSELVARPGGFRSLELKTLDWEWRDVNDKAFGKMKERSRLVPITELGDGFLAADWDEGSLARSGGRLVHIEGRSVDLKGEQWQNEQVWGIAIVNGERRHVRRVVSRRGEVVERCRSVFALLQEARLDSAHG